MIEEAKALIRLHEGWRERCYECTAGKITIGYGRNLEDVGITKAEGEFLLDNDIVQCLRDMETFSWWFHLDHVRQAVLIDMRYNLGFYRLSQFRNMLDAVGRGRWETAAAEMLDSTWAGQVGRRATRLAHMMRTGEM